MFYKVTSLITVVTLMLNTDFLPNTKSIVYSGSIQATCYRGYCEWHKDDNIIKIEEEESRVYIKGLPSKGVYIHQIKLKNLSGGEDYIFSGKDLTGKEGRFKVRNGEYEVIPTYYAPGPVTAYRVVFFVRWIE